MRLRHELGQGGRQRSPQGRIDIAVGTDDQEAAVVQPAGDELQEQKRRFVSGVKVVEHDHERASPSGALKEGPRRFEEAEARALPFNCRWLWELGESLAQLGKELSEIGRAGAQPRPKRLGVRI